MIPSDFIQTLLSPGRHRRGDRPLGAAQEGGRQLRGLLPVPQREDALVHGQPHQAVLSLLRLRRARHGHRLPDGARRQVLPRSGRGAGPRRRARGAACRARPATRERREEAQDLCEILLGAARFYRGAAEGRAGGHRRISSARADGRDRGPFRHRLRARRVAGSCRRVSQATTIPRSKPPGSSITGDGGKRYDRFRDRIMFPIHDSRGRVIGFGGRVLEQGEPKYLNSPETAVFSKGRELYGLYLARNAIRDAGRVVVVEGYMDVVALAQHGVGYAVATLGTATTAIARAKALPPDRRRRLLLRRRRRRAQGRVARARKHAAGARGRQGSAASCSCPTARIPTISCAGAARRHSSRRWRAPSRCPSSCCRSWPPGIRPRRAEGRAALVAAATPYLGQIARADAGRAGPAPAGRTRRAAGGRTAKRCCPPAASAAPAAAMPAARARSPARAAPRGGRRRCCGSCCRGWLLEPALARRHGLPEPADEPGPEAAALECGARRIARSVGGEPDHGGRRAGVRRHAACAVLWRQCSRRRRIRHFPPSQIEVQVLAAAERVRRAKDAAGRSARCCPGRFRR